MTMHSLFLVLLELLHHSQIKTSCLKHEDDESLLEGSGWVTREAWVCNPQHISCLTDGAPERIPGVSKHLKDSKKKKSLHQLMDRCACQHSRFSPLPSSWPEVERPRAVLPCGRVVSSALKAAYLAPPGPCLWLSKTSVREATEEMWKTLPLFSNPTLAAKMRCKENEWFPVCCVCQNGTFLF